MLELLLCVRRVLSDSESSTSLYTLSGLKGICQCRADLLLLRTVHLQSYSGFATVSGQWDDVIQPPYEEDSIHFI